MPEDQHLSLECQSDASDALKLRRSNTGAFIVVSMVGQNVFVEPATLVIAALTLAREDEQEELARRINSLLHPGPRGI